MDLTLEQLEMLGRHLTAGVNGELSTLAERVAALKESNELQFEAIHGRIKEVKASVTALDQRVNGRIGKAEEKIGQLDRHHNDHRDAPQGEVQTKTLVAAVLEAIRSDRDLERKVATAAAPSLFADLTAKQKASLISIGVTLLLGALNFMHEAWALAIDHLPKAKP